VVLPQLQEADRAPPNPLAGYGDHSASGREGKRERRQGKTTEGKEKVRAKNTVK